MDVGAFIDSLAPVRETGVAISVDELEDGLTTIALPAGEVFQIGVLGPSSRLGPERRAALIPALAGYAGELRSLLA